MISTKETAQTDAGPINLRISRGSKTAIAALRASVLALLIAMVANWPIVQSFSIAEAAHSFSRPGDSASKFFGPLSHLIFHFEMFIGRHLGNASEGILGVIWLTLLILATLRLGKYFFTGQMLVWFVVAFVAVFRFYVRSGGTTTPPAAVGYWPCQIEILGAASFIMACACFEGWRVGGRNQSLYLSIGWYLATGLTTEAGLFFPVAASLLCCRSRSHSDRKPVLVVVVLYIISAALSCIYWFGLGRHAGNALQPAYELVNLLRDICAPVVVPVIQGRIAFLGTSLALGIAFTYVASRYLSSIPGQIVLIGLFLAAFLNGSIAVLFAVVVFCWLISQAPHNPMLNLAWILVIVAYLPFLNMSDWSAGLLAVPFRAIAWACFIGSAIIKADPNVLELEAV